MTRKYLQMGVTRSRRYANHKSGKKYKGPVPDDKKGVSGSHGRSLLANEPDPVKAECAAIFLEMLNKVKQDKVYSDLLHRHKQQYKTI